MAERLSGQEGGLRELLASFAENLTARVRAGGLGDVYGRDAEVSQTLLALASPLKGRVAVIGPARAGKTAVIQAAAARIAHGHCPPELAGKEVWTFTPASLPGLSARGNWRQSLDQLLSEWASHPDIILCVDEVTRAARLPGASGDDDGGGVDVALALVTAIKRLPGRCLVEAEESAWRRFGEAYSDYAQLFLPVRVEALDEAQTRTVARRVAEDLGILHGVTVSDDALEQALDLSQRYALDKAQPGKTLDVLRDTLAVAAHSPGSRAQITADDVIRRFGEHSGLPRMLLDDAVPFDEPEVLRFFVTRVLGQEQAVHAVVQSLSLLRARVHNPDRPMGVFLFLGPTGVGKTELARTLAEYLYGHRDHLARFNMADYAFPYQAAELFGNPDSADLAGRRGQLTMRLAGRMFSVIVLDEFEKAAGTTYQRFLQLFDEGLLINGNDEVVNLRNAIFILTSNFGARLIEHNRIGFAAAETPEARERRVLAETEAYFTPEFMNRMDAVCIFHPLNRAVMADIARREIGDLLRRDGLLRRRVEVDIDDEVIEHVVALGYSPHYGARYLKRQIEKIITYPVAREINARPAGATGGSIRLYLRRGRVQSAYQVLGTAAPTASIPGAADLPAPPSVAEMREALPVLAARVEALEELHGVAAARVERESVLAEMSEVSFWDNPAQARRRLDTYQQASSTVEELGSLRRALDALTAGLEAAAPPEDALARPYKYLVAELPRQEFAAWLSGPHDAAGAYVIVSARAKHAGGRQWARTVARMYLGWARRRRLAASVLGEDQSPDGSTILLVLVIGGYGVYGLLQGETGTHRLAQTVTVDGRERVQRLTASVSVLPELPDDSLPTAPGLTTQGRAVNRGGLLLNRLTCQATAHDAEGQRRFSLAGALPEADLRYEAGRILRTLLWLGADAAPSDPVRTYTRSTREKGVHDHRTGQRSPRVKQVLEGDLQMFLDEALKRRAASR